MDLRRRRVQLAPAPPPGHLPALRVDDRRGGRRGPHPVVRRPRPVRPDEGHARHPAPPGSSVIEARVRLFNRTTEVQTFLWWANVAARAGDDYQSFFPTDVHFVADHAKRAVTGFPAANGEFYGIDYRDRVTLSDPTVTESTGTATSPCPPPTCASAAATTSSAATTTASAPGSCTGPITASPPARSSGPGATIRSGGRGTATSPTPTARTSS
nr:DUF5107 domain-containing protein [Tessaracoccus coleopterorum]